MIKMFRMFPLMDADDGLDIGGQGAEAPELAEPVVEEGEEEQELAEPVIERTPQDSAFAEMRRRLEEAERRNAELEAERNQYDETLGLFFEGDNKIAQARAHHDQVPVEQVLANMEAAKLQKEQQTRLEALEAENNTLRFNQLKALDLAELKEHGVSDIKDVEELGEQYFVYRSNGMSAREAYDFIQARKVVPPKSMGKPKTSPPEKEFFTRDEVMAMSSEERTKNALKIRESFRKW
jgi:hypothetical protein